MVKVLITSCPQNGADHGILQNIGVVFVLSIEESKRTRLLIWLEETDNVDDIARLKGSKKRWSEWRRGIKELPLNDYVWHFLGLFWKLRGLNWHFPLSLFSRNDSKSDAFKTNFWEWLDFCDSLWNDHWWWRLDFKDSLETQFRDSNFSCSEFWLEGTQWFLEKMIYILPRRPLKGIFFFFYPTKMVSLKEFMKAPFFFFF